MMHSLETIYRKLRMNASVIPSEVLIVLKDFDKRLQEVENNGKSGNRNTSTDRQKPNRVSKGKISTLSVSEESGE